jgi:hypothetical protein
MDTRQHLAFHSFCYVLLPPFLCYYVTAVLVLIPETHIFRLAILPGTLYLAFRGATQIDMSFGDNRFLYLNQGATVRRLGH